MTATGGQIVLHDRPKVFTSDFWDTCTVMVDVRMEGRKKSQRASCRQHGERTRHTNPRTLAAQFLSFYYDDYQRVWAHRDRNTPSQK